MTVSPGEQRVLFEVRRNLTQIGVETRFTARGDRLLGTIALSGEQVLRAPDGGPPIESLSFHLGGDGTLVIDEPESLRGMVGPHGAKVASVDALAAALRKAIDSRFARLHGQASHLRGFGLDFQVDPKRMRLVARVDLEQQGVVVLESDGTRLVARELIGKHGTISMDDLPVDLRSFEDRTDLALFLSSEAERVAPEPAQGVVVSGHLAAEVELEAVSEEVGELVSGLLPPNVGERWVMEVRVDSDDGEEVRYRGIDITGSAYGAPRVLPKAAFDKIYTRYAQGYRMLVQVVDVDEDRVKYMKLDRERRPESPERSVTLPAFLANFTGESAVV